MTKPILLNFMYFPRNWKHLFYVTFILAVLQGFGGKFGVQSDRMDKSAHKFEEKQESIGTNYQRTKPDVQGITSRSFSRKTTLTVIIVLFI